jgi:hypothetical protein
MIREARAVLGVGAEATRPELRRAMNLRLRVLADAGPSVGGRVQHAEEANVLAAYQLLLSNTAGPQLPARLPGGLDTLSEPV